MASDETDEMAGAKNREGNENVSEPIVRPFGYVADRPIIRGIGNRSLYIGNGLAADPEYHDQTFRYVLSATQNEYPLTTHHRPLIDGPDNDWSAFERAVETARTLYRRDGSLLIHCKAGIRVAVCSLQRLSLLRKTDSSMIHLPSSRTLVRMQGQTQRSTS